MNKIAILAGVFALAAATFAYSDGAAFAGHIAIVAGLTAFFAAFKGADK